MKTIRMILATAALAIASGCATPMWVKRVYVSGYDAVFPQGDDNAAEDGGEASPGEQ